MGLTGSQQVYGIKFMPRVTSVPFLTAAPYLGFQGHPGPFLNSCVGSQAVWDPSASFPLES